MGEFMIYVTGDTHGNALNEMDRFSQTNYLTRDDAIIITGDFGFIWSKSGKYKKVDDSWLRYMERKPYKVFFIDGNHENFDLLESYPLSSINGIEARMISNNIFHLLRGKVYILQGNRILTIGGASSIDKYLRIPGVSWWSRELLSFKEQEDTFAELEKHMYKVDYVITHTAPNYIIDKLPRMDYIDDPVSHMLSSVSERLDFNKWYFGHFHLDIQVDDKFNCLYNKIIKLGDGITT